MLAFVYDDRLANYRQRANFSSSAAAFSAIGVWEDVGREFDNFDNSVPDNTIGDLETFIRIQMNELETENCYGRLTAFRDEVEATADFFSGRRNAIMGRLLARCVVLSRRAALEMYAGLQAYFTDRLAGRFPFAGDQPWTVTAEEASPAAIAGFFAIYDRLVQSGGIQAMRGDPRAIITPASRFLDQMADVRSFLSPLLDSLTAGHPPTYTVEASFRSERDRERGAEQVAAWGLAIGQTTMGLRDDSLARRARWQLGNEVRMTFRWAANSSLSPVGDSRLAGIETSQKTVTFSIDNDWSLITLLQRYAVQGFSDPDPHTLVFEVPTEGGESGELRDSARLFVRLHLRHPYTGVLLTLPYFPDGAPLWETDGVS